MTITIELSPAEEARLRAQARERGQAPETIAQNLVRASLDVPTSPELLNTSVTEEAHAALVRLLLQDGLLTTLPTRPGQTMPFTPIIVLGRPVSETLLEDRE